jgi:serine/threonine protein phosphatase 1
MRVLAIGDIHGCSRALDSLLAVIGPRSNDLIITLGDYVDRGPDSAGVINRLLQLRQKSRLVCLRGNHEQLMLMSRLGNDRLVEWAHSGAGATLASYAAPGAAPTLADIPAEHWNFIEHECVDWYETATHLFVHAGVDPDLAMEDQPGFVLQWERFHDPKPHASGKVVVCGHTPQRNGTPRNYGHAICIDTGAFRRGWLTCYEVTTGYLWQTTQTGEFRSGWLNDFADHAGVEVT